MATDRTMERHISTYGTMRINMYEAHVHVLAR